MLGAGSAVVLLLPLGNSAGLYRFPALGFGWQQAGQVYVWAFLLAGLAVLAVRIVLSQPDRGGRRVPPGRFRPRNRARAAMIRRDAA